MLVRELRAEDASKIILRPYVTEKTFEMLEKENKIVFIVDDGSSKGAIKNAVETLYKIVVDSVNTVKTIHGKKAYVVLHSDYSASELASRMGLV